jgi:hypothetical protein
MNWSTILAVGIILFLSLLMILFKVITPKELEYFNKVDFTYINIPYIRLFRINLILFCFDFLMIVFIIINIFIGAYLSIAVFILWVLYFNEVRKQFKKYRYKTFPLIVFNCFVFFIILFSIKLIVKFIFGM